jgi:hypothetical protein
MMIDLPKTYFAVAKFGVVGGQAMTMNQIVLRSRNPCCRIVVGRVVCSN